MILNCNSKKHMTLFFLHKKMFVINNSTSIVIISIHFECIHFCILYFISRNYCHKQKLTNNAISTELQNTCLRANKTTQKFFLQSVFMAHKQSGHARPDNFKMFIFISAYSHQPDVSCNIGRLWVNYVPQKHCKLVCSW